MTSTVHASSRPSHTWSFCTQLAAKILDQKSYPSASLSPSTTTWSANSFEKLSLAPIRTKKVPSVTMKLGSRVFSTIVPLNQPTSMAKAKDSGTAMYRLIPAPPLVPDILGQQDHEHRRGARHRSRRQVELAADHQQRHGHGHDPEDRRHVQVVGRAGRRAEHVRQRPEEDPHRGGADQCADLGTHEQALDRPAERDPFVDRDDRWIRWPVHLGCGDRRHGVTSGSLPAPPCGGAGCG